MIGIVNYGMGNIRSIWHALDHLGYDAMVGETPNELASADHLILPGVGAFPAAMEQLRKAGLADTLNEHALIRKKPILGICLGMQLLADFGTEFGKCDGLGWIPGSVEPIPRRTPDLRLPQIGWNEIDIKEPNGIFAEIYGEASCYFVHSYQFLATNPKDVTATTYYGGPITAAVGRNNIFGAQFHPEKSQRIGLSILNNFATL